MVKRAQDKVHEAFTGGRASTIEPSGTSLDRPTEQTVMQKQDQAGNSTVITQDPQFRAVKSYEPSEELRSAEEDVDFLAVQTGEVFFEADEAAENHSEWVLVKNAAGAVGWVPSAVLVRCNQYLRETVPPASAHSSETGSTSECLGLQSVDVVDVIFLVDRKKKEKEEVPVSCGEKQRAHGRSSASASHAAMRTAK